MDIVHIWHSCRLHAWVTGIIFKLIIAADCTCMAWGGAASSMGSFLVMWMGQISTSIQLYDHDMEIYGVYIPWISWIIELDDGKIYRKALYLMVKTMVSCKFSLKPIQWLNSKSQETASFWPNKSTAVSPTSNIDAHHYLVAGFNPSEVVMMIPSYLMAIN